MIEIEKKFTLKAGDKNRLLKGAKFIKTIVIKDTYYDTKNYSLAKKDWWLRKRNGSFELKVSLRIPSKKEKYAPTQYRELETEKEIRKALGIVLKKPLKETLGKAGYAPIFSLATAREKYKKEGFNIDLDVVDYGYELAEIELMVGHKSQMREAEEKINAFAKNHGLNLKLTRGKVLEYIRRYQPAQYRAILNAWEENTQK